MTIQELLEAAQGEPKGRYSIYSTYMRKVAMLNMPCQQYEQAARQLADILRV